MADVRVDVELTTSLKGVQTELAKVLRPIEQLLQKISGNATLDLQLTRQGAGLVSKQLEEFAAKAGIDQKEAKKLGDAFRTFVADIDRYLRSVRRGELEEAGRRLDSAMKSLQTFTEGVAAWDEKLKKVTLPALRLTAKSGGKATIDPNKIIKTVEALEADLGRFFADRAKKEAQELRKQLYLQLQSIKHAASKGSVEEAKQTLEDLYKQLKTSGALPDPRALKDIQKALSDLRKQVNDLVTQTAIEVQRLAKEYLVSSTLPKLAPGVDPDALLRAYSYLGGQRQALLDAFFNALVKQDPFSNMAAGQTAKGLQKTVAWLVGNIEQEMALSLLSSEYGRDLIASKGQQAFIEQLSAAYGLLSQQLLHTKPDELKRVADMFLRDVEAAKAKFNIALDDVRGIGIALKAVADQLGKYTVMEKLTLLAYSNQLGERAEGNPLTGAYRYGRQQALDTRHEDYLRAFLPGLYKRYEQLRNLGDPRALRFRADVIARLGTSIDAMHGLLLNSLANFVSGIGIGVFFGTVYAISQYVQQMKELNKQLLAYKKILEMRGEQSMAESVSSLRERLLELAKASGVAVEEVARLFGTVARNGMSTDGLERLLGVVGRLNEVFGIPFDALRKDIAETLLQHRQYFLGPDTISRVLEYGGPQADKALNIFNELIKQTNSAAFSFDELAKAVRYYLDTGKPVKDSFYEIAKAVEYGGVVAEETAKKLHEMAQETVDFGQILTRGDEYQDNLQRLQKQMGLTISALGHDIMARFGIGEASTFMVTLQAMLTGFLALVKGLQDLINAVLNLKVIGPLLQAALAVLTGTGIIALTVSMFRLLGLFATRVMESVLATTAILRSANLTTGIATATNLLVALRANLVKFFTTLGVVIATAGTGALNLLRSGGLAALAGSAITAARVGVGAALAGGAAIASALGPVGWIALGATALVGTGIYMATRNAQRRNEEINKQVESGKAVIPFDRIEQSGSVVKLFSPDNTTGTPTYTIDLEKLRSKEAVDKFVAGMLGKLKGADALIYEHVISMMRSLGIQDKASLEQYRKQLEDLKSKLIQDYADAAQKKNEAQTKLIAKQLRNVETMIRIIDSVGKTYIEAAQRASGVMKQEETVDSFNAQYQAKLTEMAEELAQLPDWEKVKEAREAALSILNTMAGDIKGKALAALRVAEQTFTEIMENLARRLDDELAKAEALPTEAAKRTGRINAYKQHIARLQAESSNLRQFFRRAGVGEAIGQRLFNTINTMINEARIRIAQENRLLADWQRSVTDAGAQAIQQLNNVMKEAFYGPTSTPSLTAKLLATAESILTTTANDAPEKAATVARQVNAYLAKNLAVAQQYDREVQAMLNEFAAAKRVSDPEKRFHNLKLVTQKYLSEYSKKLNHLPGLALQIADQIEAALFKDGGMLSAINSLADSTIKDLKNIAERVKQKDYGPFADVGKMLEGLVNGVETLNKVSVMTADFKDLTDRYNKLLNDVRTTQIDKLDKIIADSRAEVQKYKSLPGLSSVNKAYVEALEAHIERLVDIRKKMARLAEIEKQLANVMLDDKAKQKLLSEKVQLESQLTQLRADATKRIQDLSTAQSQLMGTLTDYTSSLKDAVVALVTSLKDMVNNISKSIDEQKKRLDKVVEAYLQRGTRVSPVEEVDQEFKNLQEDLKKQFEDIEQLKKAIGNLKELLGNNAITTLKEVLELLANNKSLPDGATQDKKQLYEALKAMLPKFKDKDGKPITAKDLLNQLSGIDNVTKAIETITGMVNDLENYTKKREQEVTKHYQGLRKAAELRENVQRLQESKNKLVDALSATDDIEIYRGEVEDILNQAQARQNELNELKAKYPKLDTSDIENILNDINQIAVEYFSKAVDNITKSLPQLSGALNLTTEDRDQIDKALKLWDQLSKAIDLAPDDKTRAALKDVRSRLFDPLVQLFKESKDESIRTFIEQTLGPKKFKKFRAEMDLEDFRKDLAELDKLASFKIDSSEDIPAVEEQLAKAQTKYDELQERLAHLVSSGLYPSDTIDELSKSLVEIGKRISDAERQINERQLQLLEQQDAQILEGARKRVDGLNTLIRELFLSGKDIREILSVFNAGVEELLSIPLDTDKGKADMDALVKDFTDKVVSLLTDGSPFGSAALKSLFGDALEFLKSVEGFGKVDDPQVRTRIIAAIQAKLKENKLDITPDQAANLASAIISQALTEAKDAYEAQAKAIGEMNFDDIAVKLGSGDLSALQDYAPKIKGAGDALANMVHLAKLLSLFGEQHDDNVTQAFLSFASNTIGSIENVPNTLQELVSQGKLSELAVTDWLEKLIDTLDFINAMLIQLAKDLHIPDDKLAPLQKQILDAKNKLVGSLNQSKAAALQMYLRGGLTSDEFNRKVRREEVLYGAKSMTDYVQLAEDLVQVFSKLDAHIPGLSEAAKRSRLISRLSAVPLLDDKSLLKLLKPDATDVEITQLLNNQKVKDGLEVIREAIKRFIKDLQDETQKELEQMLDGLVNSFRDALANLFTSIFTIPVQMLRAWREQQKQLQEMRFELRLAASDVEYWQQKYDEAVKTYGVLSDEARKYAEKVAEAKRAHEELSERIKETENSAKSLFSYLLDAIAQFLEALAQAILQQAAFRAATWLVDTTMGAVFGGGGSGGSAAPASSGGGLSPQSLPTNTPSTKTTNTPSMKTTNVQPQGQAAAAANAGSGLVSGIMNVGSTVATHALSGAIASLGVAAPIAGLLAGVAVSIVADWVADIADRAFNSKYYTFAYGTKGRFDDMPSPVRLQQQPVNVNVQVQAELDKNKIAKETTERLVKELIHAGV